jgi:nucleoside-diphosphate-sugar epimerase
MGRKTAAETALVTGAGGFLGGAIARRLVEEGWQVRSFSRREYPALAGLGIDHHRGDLGDARAVARACRNVDIVFHVAAKAGIWGPRREFYEANVVGTRNILSACRENRIERLVYTSSPSVVFNGRDMEGVDESVPYPDHFKAAYPETKAEAERLVLAADCRELATVSLRPHLIWGPGDTHLVPGILERARSGSLRRIGRENKLVDFTYIDNAALAHVDAAHHLEPGSPAAGRAFFISQGEPMPLWDFVNRLLDCGGVPPVQKGVPRGLAYGLGALFEAAYGIFSISGEPRLTRFLVEELSTAHWFDISAARETLQYTPIVTMQEGFRHLEKSLKNEPD